MKIKTIFAASIIAVFTTSANAATLFGVVVNEAVTSYDLDDQGFTDWARFSGSLTAEVEKAGSSIITSTLVQTGVLKTFNTSHTFVQGTSNDNTTVATSSTSAGLEGSLTASFGLLAGNDYQIKLYGRVVNAGGNRADVRMTAIFDGATEITDAPRTFSLAGGAYVYMLNLTDVTVDDTLTIALTNFNQGTDLTAGNISVRIGAVGVTQITAIPEPTTTALLGLGGLALILRRRK
jgi:hypothetical protein